MRRDDLYLGEIVEAADRIGSWLDGVDLSRWSEDEMVRSAVLQQLTSIGEATRALSAETREKYDDVPWERIVAFRNRAVHEYFAIDWPTVWSIVQKELPRLRNQVMSALRSEFPDIAERIEEGKGEED